MTKFTELVADVILEPKVDTLILSQLVDIGHMYTPKFIMVRRVGVQPGYTATPTIRFRVELSTPAAPGVVFVTDEFQLMKENLRRAQGITIWGGGDRLDVHAVCDVGTHIQMLVSCEIDEGVERVEAAPEGTTLTLTQFAPDPLPKDTVNTATLKGLGFAAPMLVRFWDNSVYMGDFQATVASPTQATVAISPASWPKGTGGVDVVVDGQFSNQLQFQVV